jgi:nucleoside-diphosphate-sugar epimerase
VVLGDVRDPDALARLCQGAEVLVHAAGLVKAPSRQAFEAVNVEGARLAAAAAARAGAARMLLVSSLAAREPQLSHYAASKRAGEAAAQASFEGRFNVLRPPAIYGPGDLETLAVFRAASRAPVLPLFDPRARIALIHVRDAARQIAAAAEAPPERAVVALCDGRPEGYAWREIVEAAARAVGRRPRLMRAPPGLLAAAGAVGSASRALGAAPILTWGKARELRWLDWSLRPEELWVGAPQAEFDLDAGFSDTVRWGRDVARLAV